MAESFLTQHCYLEIPNMRCTHDFCLKKEVLWKKKAEVYGKLEKYYQILKSRPTTVSEEKESDALWLELSELHDQQNNLQGIPCDLSKLRIY